jgi:tetratricopeptide (TPR) repeat protein
MVQAKIEIFTAMLAEQPENAMIWYGLAAEQYKLKNWAEAAKSLRRVVSLNPDYTAAYQLLGTALANAGDLAGAQQPGEMALRSRIVPARGRPSNICAPCWRALPAPMRLSAPTRGLKCRLKIPRIDVAGLSKGARLFYFFHGASSSSYLSLR